MVSGIGSYGNYSSYLQTQAARERPDPAEMFNRVDGDGSGGVSQTELETFVAEMSSRTGDSIDTTDAVATYDSDGDGELSAEELKSFMEASGIMPPPPPPGGAGGMNGGGSDDESTSASADSVISAYDTNGDGVLSSDELQAYLDEEDNSSLNAMMKQALSAYAMNYGESGISTLEEALMNFGGENGYSPVDLAA